MAGGGQLHSCTACAVSYTTRSNLERHVRERHSGERHVCDRCGAAFPRRYRLQAHVRSSHAGREPYQCCLCPATAASRPALARHVRCHAAAGGGMACPDCGEVFSHYWRMKLHRRHHRAPRYGCRVCGRVFRHGQGLTEHRLKEHPPPPTPPAVLEQPSPDPPLELGLGPELFPVMDLVPPLDPELARELGPELGPGLGPGPGPELGPGLGPPLVPEIGPDLPPELGPELGLGLGPELPPELADAPAPEPPELQLELDAAELDRELGAELARLLGDGVRMELQQSTAEDEAVMVITLLDE